jgi:AraC family transcriptional regulator
MAQLQRRWTRRQQRIESVLQYIESHNGESVDVSALASMASISPFHFHRVFSSQVGEPVLAYIRRLRLEKAAFRILFMHSSVTEVAAQAGYSSPAAFTRAFRMHYGTTPKKFVRKVLEGRQGDEQRGGVMPTGPVFRRIPALELLGVKRLGPYSRSPWAAWQALRGFLHGSAPGVDQWTRVGIPLDWPELTPEPRRRYEACVVSDAAADGEFFRKQLPGGSYAVFLHQGPYQGLPSAHEWIFWHWLPDAGIRLRDAPAIHFYLDPDDQATDPASLRTEICIPVDMPQIPRTVSGNDVSFAQAEW